MIKKNVVPEKLGLRVQNYKTMRNGQCAKDNFRQHFHIYCVFGL